MKSNVLAIDQGTTGTTVLILDASLNVLSRANQEFPQIYPQPGWVEHDPEAIWSSTTAAIRAALTKGNVSGDSIAAIGITNQRETTVIWDRTSGQPIHNAIVWQCRRTSSHCDQLKSQGLEELFRTKTGLILDAYFSGTKIAWLLDNVDGARRRAENGELAFGTIDSYLIWRLSQGRAHVTDVTNACRTLLYNLNTNQWDAELCQHLTVPMNVLPEIHGCSEVYATTSGLDGLPDGIPIAGIAGDQQAALFGQACFETGQAKCTYGTGAFALVNTGDRPLASAHGMLTSAGWQINGNRTYVLEGSAFIAGAAVQWLRDGLGMIEKASDIEALAASVPDSGGVSFVPALTGLGAPHWRADARGAFLGITRGTTSAHMARAVLEGIALQIADILKAMTEDLGSPLRDLRVDGGACQNGLLMQYQADILGVEIIRPKHIETTAIGAACLAGLATGVWTSLDDVRQSWGVEQRFQPRMHPSEVAAHLEQWANAVGRA